MGSAVEELFSAIYEGLETDSERSRAWERYSTLQWPRGVRVPEDLVPAPAPLTVAGAEELVSMPLHEARSTYGAYLESRVAKGLRAEHNAFAALNGALSQEGTFIYVPPGSQTTATVSHAISRDGAASFPRLHVFVGKGASLKLDLQIEGEATSWTNAFVDIAIEDNAHVQLITRYGDGHIFDHLRATLKRDATFKSWGWGGHAVRRDLHFALSGENGNAECYGGWQLKEAETIDTKVLIEHIAPNCRSTQLFKGVLADSAKSRFEGKIYVHKEAQKTDAFQLNNNLLLSDRASAHSLPNLEIFADDVKASHGSTTGQFHPDDLFYLRSRGIPLARAKELLVHAFIQPVLPPDA